MKMSIRSKRAVVFVVAALGFADAACAEESPLVVLSLPSEAALAERGIVTFSITNPTDENMAVVSLETPFAIADDRLANPEFEVSDASGRELPYKGCQVRFGPPEASTFLLIGPHQTLSKNVDLASDYDIHKGGAYKVTYAKTLRLLHGSWGEEDQRHWARGGDPSASCP